MYYAVKLILLFLTAQPNPGIYAESSVERAVSDDGIECVILRIGGTSKVDYVCRDMLKTVPKLPGVVPQYDADKTLIKRATSFRTYKPSITRIAQNYTVKF